MAAWNFAARIMNLTSIQKSLFSPEDDVELRRTTHRKPLAVTKDH